jgi:uncharacterized protein
MGVNVMTGQIHKFRVFDKDIVLDVNSGSIFEIDAMCSDILDLYNKYTIKDIIKTLNDRYSESDIRQAYAEIEGLIAQGMLFSKADFSGKIDELNKKQDVKALCLNVAHDCNLRCKYCFASKGDYEGKRELMSPEVGKEAVKFLAQKSGALKNVEIDFFGGEPLLAWDTVTEVVSYARSVESKYNKKFHFTMTTNSTLLDDNKIDYLHKNMDNIVLSLDGRKSVNDKIRVRADGSGSYDSIIKNIAKIVELRQRDKKEYYVRGTFTKHNLDFSKDVFHLADMGFREISIEPVVGDSQDDFILCDSDIDTIHREYGRIAAEYLKRKESGHNPFRFYHFNVNIYNGPCIYKRLTACGAGRQYLAVVPNGNIYPCHQFVGRDEFLMGAVFQKELNEDIVDRFKNTHVFVKPDCSRCWARFFCSGGCNANNFALNGDMNKPYELTCQLQKKRIEYAIYLNIKQKPHYCQM